MDEIQLLTAHEVLIPDQLSAAYPGNDAWLQVEQNAVDPGSNPAWCQIECRVTDPGSNPAWVEVEF